MNFSMLTLAVVISCAHANHNTATIKTANAAVAAPLAAAPVVAPAVAPAVITARSYQVFARNYNALAAPVVAASPVVAAPLISNAPFIAGAPIVAAEPSPVAQSRTASTKSEKSTLQPNRRDQASKSAAHTDSMTFKAVSSLRSNDAVVSPAAVASPILLQGSAVPEAQFLRQSVVASPAAIVPGTASYVAAPYTYTAGFPFVAAPYFSSAFATSEYVKFI